MSTLSIEQLIKEVRNQKYKYHKKVLSGSAVDVGFQRIRDIYPYLQQISAEYTLFFNFLNISSIYTLGLNPSELEPLNIDFEIELPSLEEYLEGIKIKIEPIEFPEAFKEFELEEFQIEIPPLSTIEELTPEIIIKPFVLPAIETEKRKLVIGVTKYGEGYVDPPLVREFLRSTYYMLLKKRFYLPLVRNYIDEFCKVLNIETPIIETLYNRAVLLHQALYEGFVLGYNVLGVSKLSRKEGDYYLIDVITYRGDTVTVRFRSLQELLWGFILGVTPLGYGLLLPREEIFKKRLSPRRGIEVRVLPEFVHWRYRRLLGRMFATPLAYSNYQRFKEMYDYHASDRTGVFGELTADKYFIESVVASILDRYDVDKVRQVAYRKAVLQLIGYVKKRHRWGYKIFRYMDEETFKKWWIEHWVRQGLNKAILEELYERCRIWLKPMRRKWEELGKKVKRLRYQLAQAKV